MYRIPYPELRKTGKLPPDGYTVQGKEKRMNADPGKDGGFTRWSDV